MRVLVLGGCGFVGSKLCLELCRSGMEVTVVDAVWFGNFLPFELDYKLVIKDLSELQLCDFAGFDVVIHLANVANDPSAELNESLSWNVNVLETQRIVEKSISAGVKKIIYASSGSVYGISDEEFVTEGTPLLPISKYNKTKMVAERVLLSYASDIDVYIVRPATVCGLSPRMRFDVAVNLLVRQAVINGEMLVLGGSQVRPNVHIDDLVSVYLHMVEGVQIMPGIYNVGFENIAIKDLAVMIAEATGSRVKVSASNDPRSYRLDSSKLLATGFEPSKNVGAAIEELVEFLSTTPGSSYIDQALTVQWMTKCRIS